MSRYALLAWALLVAGCAAHAPGAGTKPDAQESLALAVFPTVILEGKQVSVSWRIERDSSNREHCVKFTYANGAPSWRTSCQGFGPNPATAPRFWPDDGRQRFFTPPAGRYEVMLTVRRSDGSTRRAVAPLCVSGPEFSCFSAPDALNPFDASQGGF